jgi:hypothetical protein
LFRTLIKCGFVASRAKTNTDTHQFAPASLLSPLLAQFPVTNHSHPCLERLTVVDAVAFPAQWVQGVFLKKYD